MKKSTTKLAMFRLNLAREWVVIWDNNGTEQINDYKIFYQKGNNNHNTKMDKLLEKNSGTVIVPML
jgi:hypothetical protein